MIVRTALAFACLALMMPTSASAQGLLGGLLGGGGSSSDSQSLLGVVGGPDSGALVTLSSGNAGTSGAANIGLGGSNGAVTANVGGGSEPLVGASVLGPSGVVDVNANLGDVGAGVTVGGPGLVDVNVRLPRGANGGNGGNGGNGNNSNGNNGDPGSNGNNGLNGNTANTALRTGIGSADPACVGTNVNQLMALFQQSNLNGWNRASNIQLIPMQVCRDIRRQMAAWLAANPGYHSLVGAVSSDALITAALSRTSYQPGHVVGVQRQGATLMVYVF